MKTKKEVIRMFVLAVGVSLIFIGLLSTCGGASKEDQPPINYKIVSGIMYEYERITVIEIHGCQYIIFQGTQKGGIIHKQNCPNH